MANFCDNRICIVSTERGVGETIYKMLKNLEAAECIQPLGDLGATAPVRDLSKLICDAFMLEPVYLVALGAYARPMSETALIGVGEFVEDVWGISLQFCTAWDPVDFDFEEVLPDEEPWLVGHRWAVESWGQYNNWKTAVYQKGLAGDKVRNNKILTPADKEYGTVACFPAAFCRLRGIEKIPPNDAKLNHLLKADDGAAILEWKDNAAIRELCNEVNPRPLFNKRNMSAYAAVLEMSNTYYCPTKIENYFDVLLEGGYTEALSMFIKRNAWGKERADRARKYLSTKKGGKKAIELLDAELKRRELEEREDS